MNQKRKRLFVDNVVQGTLAKRIAIHWAIFFGIVLALKLLTSWTVNPAASFGEIVTDVVKSNGLFLIAIVLLLPSFVFDTVKLSHRFAGPIVRLKNELNRASESGKLEEISFRDGDFWTEIADAYNGVIRSVKEHRQENEAADAERQESQTEAKVASVGEQG